MHLEDLLAADLVRRLHRHAAVEAPGAQQRLVQDLGPVGGRQHHHAVAGLEAVHLGEDLVERLLALVVAAAGEAAAAGARAPDGVELVDEDDGRRGVLGLLEQVAHARGADAHDRLDELRRRDREERHAGLAGHGLGQQRLAGAGRPESSTPRGIRAPSFWYFSGFLRKSTISVSSSLASSMPGHVVEVHARVLAALGAAGLRAAELAEHPPPPACCAARRMKKMNSADQQQRRAEAEQQRLRAASGPRGGLAFTVTVVVLRAARDSCVGVGERGHLGLEVLGVLDLLLELALARVSPLDEISLTLPFSICSMKVGV